MTTDAGDMLPVYLGLTDTPQAFNCVHQGIRYPGQVIVGNRWRREWGQPLEGDAYFRIVLLRSRRSLPNDALRDSRIVVCLPNGTPSRGQNDVDQELRTLRESQAQYGSPSDPPGTVVHEAFQRREGELQGQMKEMEAQRYAYGSLVSPTDVSDLDLVAVFTDSDPSSWCNVLADRLLAWAYPEVALGPVGLPQPLVSEDSTALLGEVLGWGERGNPAMAKFGPALGLSTAERPGEFNSGGCPIFRRVEDLLEFAGGRLLWDGVHRLLAHADGLTSPLAILYLLSFVHHSCREVEMGLRPDHGLTYRDGTIFRGDRVVREVVPLVAWPQDVGTVAECIRKPAPLSWAGALPYVSRLVPKVSDDLVEGDLTLIQTLALLAKAVDECRVVVDRASRVLGGDVDPVLARLSPLEELSKSQGFVQAYVYAREELGSPDALSHGLDYLYLVETLGKALPGLEEAVVYLKGGEIEGGDKNLSLMREALLAQLSPVRLLYQSKALGVFTSQWESYRRDYASAYRRGHREYHDASPRLKARLDEVGARLRALGHLNSIVELGPPLGGDLEEGYRRVVGVLKSCDLGPQDLRLEGQARCPSCAMALGEELPARVVEALLGDLNAALLEQNRRLSRDLVGRILYGRADSRLDDLLKIVHASDLSSLVNTLDGELVGFIRRLVSSH